jgi:type III restriction enzyme
MNTTSIDNNTAAPSVTIAPRNHARGLLNFVVTLTRVEFSGCRPCEIGLQTYAQGIISLLVAAMTPDDTKGEPPPLPRLNRYKPIGSTEGIHFKTVKPVQVTAVSHLNFVACDTDSWEPATMFKLEKLAKEGVVYCYAPNDHLEFNVPYELCGIPHVYEPDFLVRLTNGVTLLVEVKGRNYDSTDVKHQAARRWVSAVSHWGRLGEWEFVPCRNPQRLPDEIAKLIAARIERLRSAAASPPGREVPSASGD